MVSRLKIGRGVKRQQGFTLLELMIVMIIMLILMSITVPIYNRAVVSAREAVLRNDLFELRKLISQYTLDKQKAPQSLDDLVQAGYLKELPKDPMTHESNWEPKMEENVISSPDQQDPGIDDVHSASNMTSSDGTAYSTW
jgi:general secretion pathway protein G